MEMECGLVEVRRVVQMFWSRFLCHVVNCMITCLLGFKCMPRSNNCRLQCLCFCKVINLHKDMPTLDCEIKRLFFSCVKFL